MIKVLKDALSYHDALALVSLIHRTTVCKEENGFKKLIVDLKHFVDYEYAICVLRRNDKKGKMLSYDAINISCPHEWLELYVTKRWDLTDSVLSRNYTDYKLQYWNDTFKRYPPNGDFLPISYDFGLRQGYTHGVRDLNGKCGSLLSLSGKTMKRDKRAETTLEFLIPHLHQAITRVLVQSSVCHDLSSREIEVLNWLKEGKNTWDISVILNISERTVKFHISNIMQKLDASNRAHAVAIAIEQDLIGI